jgi:hypothetical protein
MAGTAERIYNFCHRQPIPCKCLGTCNTNPAPIPNTKVEDYLIANNEAQSNITVNSKAPPTTEERSISITAYEKAKHDISKLKIGDRVIVLSAAEQKKILDQAGQLLSYYPNLQLEMITYLSSTEKQTTLDSRRSPLIRDYLVNRWKIDAEGGEWPRCNALLVDCAIAPPSPAAA